MAPYPGSLKAFTVRKALDMRQGVFRGDEMLPTCLVDIGGNRGVLLSQFVCGGEDLRNITLAVYLTSLWIPGAMAQTTAVSIHNPASGHRYKSNSTL
jgi:hypothetical protein